MKWRLWGPMLLALARAYAAADHIDRLIVQIQKHREVAHEGARKLLALQLGPCCRCGGNALYAPDMAIWNMDVCTYRRLF